MFFFFIKEEKKEKTSLELYIPSPLLVNHTKKIKNKIK